MKRTRLFLVLLLVAAAACSSDAVVPTAPDTPVFDGGGHMGTGN